MELNKLKKALLAGTALVAVAGFAAGANAQVAVSNNSTARANTGNGGGDLITYVQGTDINVDENAGPVVITSTNLSGSQADSGAAENTFDYGVIRSLRNSATGANIASIVVLGVDGADHVSTYAGVDIDGNFSVTAAAETANTTTATVTGTAVIDGALTVTAGAAADGDGGGAAGGNAFANFNDDLTVEGASTIAATDGGNGVASDNGGAGGSVTVVLGGKNISFENGLTLTNGANGSAAVGAATGIGGNGGTVALILAGGTGVDGDGAPVTQVITGDIDGNGGAAAAVNGTPEIRIQQDSTEATTQNVAIVGNIGGTGTVDIVIGENEDQTPGDDVDDNVVETVNLTLGNAADDADYDITGDVRKANAGDVANIAIVGTANGSVTFAGAFGADDAEIDSLSVNSGEATLGATAFVNTVSVAENATLTTGAAATVSGDITNEGTFALGGTLTLNGGTEADTTQTVSGDVTEANTATGVIAINASNADDESVAVTQNVAIAGNVGAAGATVDIVLGDDDNVGTPTAANVVDTVNLTLGSADADVAVFGNVTTTAVTSSGDADITNVIITGGKKVDLTGNIDVTSLEVATDTDLTVAGNTTLTGDFVNNGTFTLSGTASELNVTAGNTFTGSVATAQNAVAGTGEGIVNIADAAADAETSIAGDLGAEDKILAQVNFGGTDGSVTTSKLSGNIYAQAVASANNDVIIFEGTAPQMVSGRFNAGSTTINAGSAVTFGSDSTIASLTNNGKIVAGADANITLTEIAGSAEGAAPVYEVAAVGSDATSVTYGQFIKTAATEADREDVTASNISVDTTAVTGTVTLDAAFAGFTLEGLVDATSEVKIADGSVLIDTIAKLGDNAGEIDIVATEKSLTDAGANVSFGENVGLAEIRAFAADSTDASDPFVVLANNIVTAENTAELNRAIEGVTSDVSAGAVAGGLTVSNQTASVTNARLASVRGADTGVAAGELAQGLSIWAQGFGTQAEQDERDGVSGYDADTYGIAFGVDTEVADNAVVGLALSYANTEVDSDALDNAETDIDSFQISLYGQYDVSETAYVTGQLGYVMSSNDTTRNINGVADAANTVTGDFDSNQIVARVEVANDYAASETLTVTPKALVNYVNYDADTYSEDGTNVARLQNVDQESLNVFEIGVGVDVAARNEYADGSAFEPTLSLGVRHDLIGDEFEATNTFAAGGSAFKVEGFDPAQTTFNIGVGATYETKDNVTLTAAYDYEFKEDYDSHSALIKAGYKF